MKEYVGLSAEVVAKLAARCEANPPSGKPFCFRCGAQPKYLIEVSYRPSPKAEVKSGPLWPLCFECALEIDWNLVLRPTLKRLEQVEDT